MGKKRRLENANVISIVSKADDSAVGRKRPSTPNRVEGSSNSNSKPTVSSDDGFPTRNIERLFASRKTFECTMDHGCVPCAYKIGCFDVALDKEFCKTTPNQRPEQCPRSNQNKQHGNHSSTETNEDGSVMGFYRGMSVLTVGDGDFSFSLGLARKLLAPQQHRRKHKQSTFLVATSYESESTLRKVYPDFDTTLRELNGLGVHVAYNVDATRILETLSLPDKDSTATNNNNNSNHLHLARRFHRICWNFPCTAIARGQDGQNTAMEDNKELVRNFVQSSRSVLTDRGDGELYICHKTKPPFNQWNLEDVALQKQQRMANHPKAIRGSNATPPPPPLLYYSGRIVLDRFLLPPYTPRKALDKKSFPCHDACFYIFAQEPPTNSDATSREKLFSPTIPQESTDPNANPDSGCGNQAVPIEPSSATTLVRIHPESIRLIRQKHMGSTSTNARKKRKRHTKQHKKVLVQR